MNSELFLWCLMSWLLLHWSQIAIDKINCKNHLEESYHSVRDFILQRRREECDSHFFSYKPLKTENICLAVKHQVVWVTPNFASEKKTGKEKWEVHTESKCTYIPSVMTCLSEQNGIISSGKDHFILLPQSLTSSESKYKGQHWALFCTLQGYDWWYKTVDGSRLLEHKAFKCLFLLWMWCTLVMNMLRYSNLRQKKEFYFWGIIHSCEQDEAANVWGWGAALPAAQHSRLGAATESGCAQGLYGKYPQSWEQRGWKVKLCGDVSLQYVQ